MKIHIVQKGDTLWNIAKKYGVNFEELKKMNSQLSNPDMIMPGMKIKVPTSGGMVIKEAHMAPMGVKKEVPIAEHPFAQQPMPAVPVMEGPKEIIKKEVQKEYIKVPYVPKMPQPIIPEIDINNYYTMNMANMSVQQQQAVVQQPAPPPQPVKEAPKPAPVAPMPVQMPVQQPCAQMPIQEGCCPPPPSCCVPVTPIMPGSGFYPDGFPQQPMGYGPNPMMGYPQQPAMGYPSPMMEYPQQPTVAYPGASTNPMMHYGPMHGIESSSFMQHGDESSSFMPYMPMAAAPGYGMGMPTTSPMNPSYGMNPTYPTNPGYEMNPTYPTNPGYGMNPAYPTNPGYEMNPAYPTNPGYGMNPAYPTNPGYGMNPAYSTNPGYEMNPAYSPNPTYTNPTTDYSMGTPPYMSAPQNVQMPMSTPQMSQMPSAQQMMYQQPGQMPYYHDSAMGAPMGVAPAQVGYGPGGYAPTCTAVTPLMPGYGYDGRTADVYDEKAVIDPGNLDTVQSNMPYRSGNAIYSPPFAEQTNVQPPYFNPYSPVVEETNEYRSSDESSELDQ